ncbi:DUF3168 domain-containing protein [Nocardiopsis exhalans]|uniref:DUF3168 domain-containing protein n=1 Tax=Nocardiopsis exhalans TaxID=163604 RepID=A0ABY5D6Y5_9ACTN|nr:DUF3168 domain-containing protein [Nocardiopsis exhalans]USY19725.1 DUF3168 domain-containing protein [Nocardiopsis exhalans]
MSSSTTPARRPVADIQTALYQRLTAPDADLGAAVYDYVPEPDDASWPYVTIGEAIETPANAHDFLGRDTTLYLNVWSRYRGFAEANAVANQLTALLDHRPAELNVGPGQYVTSVRFEFSQTLRDGEDPRIRRVAIRFRIRTAQT